MAGSSARDGELTRAFGRARAVAGAARAHQFAAIVAPEAEAGAQAADTSASPPALGSAISELMRHGGLYTLSDPAMMKARITGLVEDADEAAAIFADVTAIPAYFFYKIVDAPYMLHSRLISYLVYPNRHLGSPVAPSSADDLPDSAEGKVFSKRNKASQEIPAAFTFVGQFIDHDLTLNALNLLGRGINPAKPDPDGIVDEASPLIDLDSVYGPRVDDDHPGKQREVPLQDGYFQLRPIPGGGYDVPRQDRSAYLMRAVALIGDKRNDENQLILQVHLLLMRLHNAIRATHPEGGNGKTAFEFAKEQTILHWQSLVANEYLQLVAGEDVMEGVLARLVANGELVYRKVKIGDDTEPRLRMAHEFAIGFRYGHSQLRSAYSLNPQHVFRLFDSLSDGSNDLQGGKCLTHDRVIDWPYFLARDAHGHALHPSNLIDTEVNQVVFDLPESTIPDDVKSVSNLPFRNLVRSSDLGLCAGEDLAQLYAAVYPKTVRVLTPEQVEPHRPQRELFCLDTGGVFRTPLWYYILREAEVARGNGISGKLGPMGAHLVAEVLLSAIYFAPTSFLKDRPEMAWITSAAEKRGYATLLEIAEFVQNTMVETPPIAKDPCADA